LKLTKVQAASQIETNVDSLRSWERHQANPDVKMRPAIIKFLAYFPEPPPRSFPEALRLLRMKLGVSPRMLAPRIGTTASSILRWEHGENKPLPPVDRRLEALFQENEIICPEMITGRKTGRPPQNGPTL
jgi:DNA-binding transcriptional regulator YiaG